MTDRPLLSSRLVFGLALMGLGALWTLDQLHMLDAARVLAWWPLVVLAWGSAVFTGLGTHRRPTLGGIWIAVGVVGLLDHLQVWRFSLADLLPLFLVFVGGLIVARGWRGSRYERGQAAPPGGGAGAAPRGGFDSAIAPDARANLFALLTGQERRITSQAFVGGEASAILGGLTIDLRGAQLAQGHAMLDLFAMWGGIEVLAPAGWRVVSRVTPLLGAVVDSMPEPSGPDAPTLELRGIAVMGGVDVRSDDRVGRKIRRAIIGAHFAPGVEVGVIRARRRDRAPDTGADEPAED